MKSISVLTLAIVGASALGCGPSVASKVRGDAPTAGGSLGGACGEEPAPWVIDLPEDKANQLETEMKGGGIVLVRYDCNEFRIVRGCEVQAGSDYGYSGVEAKAKHKEIEDKDSLALTLSGGPAFAAKVASEFERGSIFRIDYSAVGRMTTTTKLLSASMLRGQKCGEVTHFVYAMDLGAYVLSSGAAADLAATAEFAGQGGKAGSSSKVKNQASGGDVDACKKAKYEDTTPPAGCRAPLLVQLFPIDRASAGGASARSGDDRGGSFRGPACPPGKVPDEYGSCRNKATVSAYICAPGQLADCRAQCDKGNPQSCAILGYMFEKGEGTKEDLRSAEAAYSSACAKKNIDGCTGLGYIYSKSDDAKLKEQSTRIFVEACQAGNGRACSGLGQQARIRRDPDDAVRQFDRGCRLGYTRACFYAGKLLARSGRDDAAAFLNFRRACGGGDNRGCLAAGSYMMAGVGTAKNPSDGARLQDQGLQALSADCKKDKYESCEILGDFFMGRYGRIAPKGDQAAEAYEKACSGGQEDACFDVGVIYEGGLGGARRDPAKAGKFFGVGCDKGSDSACAKLGKKAPAGPPGPPAPPGPRKAYCNDRGQPIRPLRPGERCP